jgi:hypothetical protein
METQGNLQTVALTVEPNDSLVVIAPRETTKGIFSTGDDAEAAHAKVRKFAATCSDLFSNGISLSLSVVVQVPLFHNPDGNGVRAPVDLARLAETEAEIRQHFDGYSRSVIEDGWYRENNKEFSDRLFRYEIVFAPTPSSLEFLEQWSVILRCRFRQRAIYMVFTGPIITW